jgi:hypothetical protein
MTTSSEPSAEAGAGFRALVGKPWVLNSDRQPAVKEEKMGREVKVGRVHANLLGHALRNQP